MGKSLIIKGADFSQNGIVPDFILLSGLQSIEGYRMMNAFEGGSTTPKFHIELTIDYSTTTNSGAVLTRVATNVNVGAGVNTSMSKSGQNLIVYFGGTQYGSFSIPLQEKFNLDIAPSTGIKVNGVTAESSGAPISSLSAMPYNCTQAPLFGGINGSGNAVGVPSTVTFTLHKFVVYADEQDTEPLQNWIPVKRIADNVMCMYDTVSDTYKEMELVS